MLEVSAAFPAILTISENKKINNTYTQRITAAHIQWKAGQINQLYQYHFADEY